MLSRTDVGISGDESATDGRRREIDPDLSARRHPLTRVARHVDEHSLETFGIDVDGERAGRFRQDQVNPLADQALQHGREIPQHALCADGLERAHLLAAIDPELAQETCRPRHVGQQAFSVPAQSVVVADAGQPFVGAASDVGEQRIARDGDLRGQASDGLHSVGLAETLFEGTHIRDVLGDDIDRLRCGHERLQPKDQAAALARLPLRLHRLCLARRSRPFEQPAQIAGPVQRRRGEIRVPQLIDAPATEKRDERVIRVDYRAVLRAAAQRVWRALELAAPLLLAPFELRLKIRNALGDIAQRFGVRPRGVELPAPCVFRDPMAFGLLVELVVAIGDQGRESGTFGPVLFRDLFERLKRGLKLRQRLTDPIILTLCRAELRLEPRLVPGCAPTIGGDDVPCPIPPTRGFHPVPREIPFEGRSRVGFLCEPLDEIRLARRPGSESGGVFLERGVVSHLKFREPRRGARQLFRVLVVRSLSRGLGGGQLPVETGAPVSLLREQVFERSLTLVRGRKIDFGALSGVLMRGFRFGERVGERPSSGDGFCQVRTEFRFASSELLRRGRQPVARLSGLRQVRREHGVPLREQVGEGNRFRRPALVSLSERALEIEEPLLQPGANPGFARQGDRVAAFYVGEPRRGCGQFRCAAFFYLPPGLFGASELSLGALAIGPKIGQSLRQELLAAALPFDRRRHDPRQIGLERRAGHDVSVGSGIERGERELEPRGSRDDHHRRRQTQSAKLLDERGAALRLHLDDDRGGVAGGLQPLKGGGGRLDAGQRDIPCNSVNDIGSDQGRVAFLCEVENLHGGGRFRFALYRSMPARSAAVRDVSDLGIQVRKRTSASTWIGGYGGHARWHPACTSAHMPDLRYAARSLLKSPGFTLVAVLTIAVGIGANTALFSAFNTLVLHPQSFPQSDRLVRLWASNGGVGLNAPAMSWPRYEFIRDHQTSFASVSVAAFTGYTITREGADPEQANTVAVTASFFPTLGVVPLYGRNFTREEDTVGGPNVVIISYEYWTRALGGRESAVGERLTLNGERYTIVGITPPALSNPYRTVLLYVPRPFEGNGLTLSQVKNGAGYLGATARLKPGITLEQARSEVATLSRDYCAAFPENVDGKNDTVVKTFAEELVGNIRPTFYLLLGAVGLVLLIACANVASLFLGRLSARHKEIAVRLSLGATRSQIVRQFLAESALFSLVAGGAGLIVAWWALAAIQRLAANQLPPGVGLALDARALVFTAGVSVCSALLVGMVPAWQASRANLLEALNDSARGSSGARSARFRSTLVVSEVTLSVVLLVLSGLLLLSFVRLQRAPAGFDPQGVATSLLALPLTRYPTDVQQVNLYDRLIERLEAQPQVKRAAVVVGLPLSGIQPRSPYAIAGRPIPPLRERALANLGIVSDHYFDTMRIPLREGRNFDARDTEKSPLVCLVNESFARRVFPGESAVGKVLLRGPNADIKIEIVGIVGDVKSTGLTAPPPETIYLRIRQFAARLTFIVVRADGDPAALRSLVRSTVIDLDPSQPIALFQTLETSLAQALGAQRVAAWLTVVFAAVALLLSALGLYSVLAYAVAQRTSEIGIRTALGARRQQVVALVLRSGLKLVAIGLVLGLAAAAGAARLIQTLLFYVQPLDPLIYSTVTVLFTVIATIACLLPSLRASRIDPIVALRAE